jgi:hypothetical protein
MGRLHQINRKSQKYLIGKSEDGSTPGVEVRFRSMTYDENLDLLEYMEKRRAQARLLYNKPEHRQTILEDMIELTKDQLIDKLISIQAPVVESVADLAPNGEAGLSEEEKKEAEALAKKKWREASVAAYADMDDDAIRERLVDRHIRQLTAGRATDAFVERALVNMVIDPETRRPMLSLEPESEDYIGALDTDTRRELIGRWNDFQRGTSEKGLREAADSPDFLPSGESGKTSAGSPSDTTETSTSSPGNSSPSIGSAVGSTP